MSLPLSTSPDDVKRISRFLARKPSGASIQDAKAALGATLTDGRKIIACQMLGILCREDGRMRLTSSVGRTLGRATDEQFASCLRDRLSTLAPYASCLEWSYEQEFSELTAPDVGAYWHDHFRSELGTSNEREIAQRAICFLQFAEGAGLGSFVMGRRGQPSRLVLDRDALAAFVHSREFDPETSEEARSEDATSGDSKDELSFVPEDSARVSTPSAGEEKSLPEGIFIGHGKNKKPLEQLRGILDQFKIPYKVAVHEPNLGRPIGEKVREIMRSCNCAILLFTADEEFRDDGGQVVWRPSENVVHEFGAASFLYGNRVVILKEDCISLPTNFRDVGYIQFERDQLNAKAMEVLRELIGFGIVKVGT